MAEILQDYAQFTKHFRFGWDFRTGGKIFLVFGENNPKEVKISKNTCLEGTSLAQTASFEPLCVRIGCVVWAVDLRKKTHTHTYIYIYIYIN